MFEERDGTMMGLADYKTAWEHKRNMTLKEYTPKVGDKVLIIKSDDNWTERMDEYVGRVVTISGYDSETTRAWFEGIENIDMQAYSWTRVNKHFIPVPASKVFKIKF